LIFKDIQEHAHSLGFDSVGLAKPDQVHSAGLDLINWVEAGYHGTMEWFAKKLNWRTDPRALWPDVQSIIMLTMSYAPKDNPLRQIEHTDRGVIYHDVIKKRLKALAGFIAQKYGAQVKVFVDTAAVMEKPLAAAAGLGWQGKHTNLLSRSLGNWFFIGSIFTTLDLPPTQPKASKNHCGSCTKCLTTCPTNAFVAPHRMDAQRCISYLTIEYDGIIPAEFRKAMGNRIYGCDDCLAVCPWNKFAQTASETAFWARAELQSPLLQDFLCLNESDFRTVFSKSPIKRIGYHRFTRNVLIAAGNSNHTGLIPLIEPFLYSENIPVQATAIWALSQLESDKDFQKRIPTDIKHPDIHREWMRTPL
jgi:epoxyqueuosine reductase